MILQEAQKDFKMDVSKVSKMWDLLQADRYVNVYRLGMLNDNRKAGYRFINRLSVYRSITGSSFSGNDNRIYFFYHFASKKIALR